jgi:hypothetical protein
MMDKFREAEIKYKELKEKRDKNEITKDEFITELQKLMIKDEDGKLWALGVSSGKWHYYDGNKWIPQDPPYSTQKNIICPYCGFENPENSIFCIKCERSLKKVSITCPRCGKELPEGSESCPYCGYTFEKEREGTEEIELRIRSVSVFSFSLFCGGFGLVIGIILGALIGVFNSFLSFDFLPDFINSTRGHFMGSILFGLGGAITGFFSLWLFGIVISLFTNLILFLFGSPKFKFSKERG